MRKKKMNTSECTLLFFRRTVPRQIEQTVFFLFILGSEQKLWCPQHKPVIHLCTWDNERVWDYGGADSNALSERDYDREWFVHEGKCFDGLGLKWDTLVGVLPDGCPNVTGKNVGLLNQMQDEKTETDPETGIFTLYYTPGDLSQC